MISPECRQIRATFTKASEPPDVPLSVQRQEWEAAAAQAPLPPGAAVSPADAGGVPGVWVRGPEAAEQTALLYVHGGGFTTGSSITHRELAARLCLASGAPVLLIDYRLAPEHPFPAGLEDVAASYRWLLARGLRPERIAIGGDSAGACLAVAALVLLRERGVALPAAGVLISPWLDLALTGPSLQSRAAIDPLCSRASLGRAAAAYLAGADPAAPLASPLYADLEGFPPFLVQVGDHEVLLSDSTRFAERARAAGVEVALEVWEELWHVWHGWAAALPEGRRAIERMGVFIRQRLALRQPA
jgi:acetyl esterase/lipase